jgi:hypothetical protein
VTKAERRSYERHVRLVAKRLGVPLGTNLEEAIIKRCESELSTWIEAHGRPRTLGDLAQLVSGALNVEVVEIHEDEDITSLLRRIPPRIEPVMARIPLELDDDTDAVVIQRQHHQPWERPFLAVINCRGWHGFRRYFSLWHELVHLLLDGRQLRFAFRRTLVQRQRRDPEEVLVDRVAARLGFFPEIFLPVFREHLRCTGRLTFDLVDRVRMAVAGDASRQATLLACLAQYSAPAYFVRAAMGMKRAEMEALESRQQGLFPGMSRRPMPKLRVQEVAVSAGARAQAVRFHGNMEVPESSVVSEAFRDSLRRQLTGRERLETWRTSSSGSIGEGIIDVEAQRMGDDQVWALIHLVW